MIVTERCDLASKLAIALDAFIRTALMAKGQPITSDAYAKHAQANYEFDVAQARYDLGRDQ